MDIKETLALPPKVPRSTIPVAAVYLKAWFAPVEVSESPVMTVPSADINEAEE
ncbi:hypothetical protein SOASR032_01660 [Pragia fontium]|uniref:Uncharacterized protein n=1 Tax=Pragia fontium TaxID=82985 RepID=A0ABQ5LFM5_9GAMM|nr:hypothetical protein SOASR032_01660 [Pragia fontium]